MVSTGDRSWDSHYEVKFVTLSEDNGTQERWESLSEGGRREHCGIVLFEGLRKDQRNHDSDGVWGSENNKLRMYG